MGLIVLATVSIPFVCATREATLVVGLDPQAAALPLVQISHKSPHLVVQSRTTAAVHLMTAVHLMAIVHLMAASLVSLVKMIPLIDMKVMMNKHVVSP